MRELAERIARGRRAVSIAKQRGMGAEANEWERRLSDLFEEAGREPADCEGCEPWMLWEWRRVSIPRWREILQASIFRGDRAREKYARWMLRDILLDPDYEESSS